jgi:hypothetical protein
MSKPIYQEMTEIYNAVVGVSTFKKLMEKNKRLEREVRALKNILYSIPEFRCKCNSVNSPKEQRRTKLRKEAVVTEEVEEVVVVIKQEKTTDPVEVVVIDDDVVVPVQENVLMNIFEKNDQICIEKIEEPQNCVPTPKFSGESQKDSLEIEDQEEIIEDDNEDDVEEEVEDVVAADEGSEIDDAVVEEEVVEESVAEESVAEESVAEESVAEESVAEESVVEEEVVEEEGGEEESEVFEITIGGKAYYTNDEINGSIYSVDENEEVGDEVGVFVNRKPTFHKK